MHHTEVCVGPGGGPVVTFVWRAIDLSGGHGRGSARSFVGGPLTCLATTAAARPITLARYIAGNGSIFLGPFAAARPGTAHFPARRIAGIPIVP